ncbi:M10 family metallopeptidase C-terminal domain-containing protein [Brevundimonas sp.]|uniref:M10 family metallopeptidase C-terminal domain-containing protein n=1 Tax=Brevundimonas sp. TaxID=1871086 RepID=UPI001A1816A3|nr:M10 family metallopeptidase C-terminal domain-containing protein [Brevundimonas sp.]MBJ7486693.1 M10 family metallopeptidase C-terminal domain-containing protein [Brevundimonas sp.]
MSTYDTLISSLTGEAGRGGGVVQRQDGTERPEPAKAVAPRQYADADALFGDAGADLFVYRSVLDSMEGAADGIFGFVSGQDRIDLSGLRNSAADVFGIAYLGTGSFLFVDIGGDGYNELVIQLANTTLVASDINWGSAPSSAAPAAGPTGAVGLTVLDEAATDFAEWSSLIGQTGGAMADLETVWAHGRHGPDWYL